MTRPGDFVRRRIDRGDLPPEEVTPGQVAELLLADIEAGRIKPTKLLVLFEEEGEDCVASSSYASALTYEEQLMMLEWWKRWLLDSLAR